MSVEGGPIQALGRSGEEVQIDELAELVRDLQRQVTEVKAKADAATEALGRRQSFRGQTIYRAQVTTAVTPRSYSTVGTGYAILCVLIGGTLYRRYPHITVPVVNDAISDSDIAVNVEVWIVMINGQWSVIWQDCGDTSPSAFSDQPH